VPRLDDPVLGPPARGDLAFFPMTG
jgi:hypothetical protein